MLAGRALPESENSIFTKFSIDLSNKFAVKVRRKKGYTRNGIDDKRETLQIFQQQKFTIIRNYTTLYSVFRHVFSMPVYLQGTIL